MQCLRRKVYDELVPAILTERGVRIRLYLKIQRQVEAEAKLLLLSQLESVLENQNGLIGDFNLALTEKGFNPWVPYQKTLSSFEPPCLAQKVGGLIIGELHSLIKEDL